MRSSSGLLFIGTFLLLSTPLACLSVAGVADFRVVDECLRDCTDAGGDGQTPVDGDGPPTDGPSGDAPADAPADAPPQPVGLSDVVLSGTGVLVGKTAVAIVTVKDAAGAPVNRAGAKVTFQFSGGTSVLTAGATTDEGSGVYRTLLTGVTEGTKVSVIASLDGVALTTPAPQIRVANPITNGLTFMLDAADVDAAGNPGAKGCPGAGPATWTDLAVSRFSGTLAGFADRCAAGSGWAGKGTPEDPHRLAFDGTDDVVDFGPVNSISTIQPANTRQTILAWVRKTGAGTAGTSGFGGTGIAATYPIVAKGTAEGETTNIDINYFLSITTANVIGIDYEMPTNHTNNPFLGTTAITDNAWVMIGYTMDVPAGTRTVYLNATADGTSNVTAGPSNGSDSHLAIGGANTSTGTAEGRFRGDIAIVQTFNRALTAGEIEKTCHAFSSRFGMKSCPN